MIRFYLVRHGETEGNKEGYFRGRFDYPLNNNGLIQAKEVAFYFKDKKVDKIYSSPLKRAYYTAKEIAKIKKLEVIKDEGFNNLYFSSWEGKPKKLIKEKYPDLWGKWIKEPENLKVDDSETIDEVGIRAKKRIFEFVEELRGENCNILITTHRVVIKALIAKLLDIPSPYFWKIHTDNASVSIIDYYPGSGFMLYKLNDTSHLSNFITEIY